MSLDPPSSCLDAALEYAGRGWRVLPLWWPTSSGRCACPDPACEHSGKHPIGLAVPHGLKDASTNADTIREWWERFRFANVGLTTGPDSFDVLDVDGPDGEGSLSALVALHGPLPETGETRTGRGRQILFAPSGLPCSTSKLGKGLDTKGAGGYVVAPPSRHATGKLYTRTREGLALAPRWLGEALARAEAAPAPRPPRTASTGAPTAYGAAALSSAASRVSSAPAGVRNDTLNREAHSLGQLIAGGELEEAEAVAVLSDAANAAGLPDAEARKTIASGIAAGKTTPRGASPRAPRGSPRKAGDEGATSRAPAVLPALVRLADVTPEAVEWLWPGRVPLGKLSILEGDPGLGKSTAALDLAARASRGEPLPGGGLFGPCPVVLLSAEDGLGDTIRPRLDAAGADVARIFALRAVVAADGAESLPTIDGNLDAIADAVRKTGARLVVIDPLMAYLGGDVNTYRDQDVRRALAPLSKMADDTGAAVLVVRHLTKGGGAASIYRGGGSIGIVGAARSALLVAKDPEDEERRIVASVKSNLSKPPASLAYRVEEAPNGAPRLSWEGEVEITANELLAAQAPEAEGGRPRDEAVSFLARYLASGPRFSDAVLRDAQAARISEKTLRRAKETLGVVAVKAGFSGAWKWRLPEDGHEPPKVVTRGRDHLRPEVATFGDEPPAPSKMATGDHLRTGDTEEVSL